MACSGLLSRTEAITSVSTYVLGIRTSWPPFEELEEAEYYFERFARGRPSSGRTYTTRNYTLRFQDGYKVKLSDLYSNCTGWDQLNALSELVAPTLLD